VCHDDNNRANNVVTNLRYDTPLANQRDRFRHGAPVTAAIVGHIAKGNSWKHVWLKFNQPIPQPFYLQPSSGANRWDLSSTTSWA
jgi:hypothetical protein